MISDVKRTAIITGTLRSGNMTIEEAIKYYENKNVVLTEEEALANTLALNTMRKYQMIKNIICKWEDGLYDDEGVSHVEILDMISNEVNGDGNVD